MGKEGKEKCGDDNMSSPNVSTSPKGTNRTDLQSGPKDIELDIVNCVKETDLRNGVKPKPVKNDPKNTEDDQGTGRRENQGMCRTGHQGMVHTEDLNDSAQNVDLQKSSSLYDILPNRQRDLEEYYGDETIDPLRRRSLHDCAVQMSDNVNQNFLLGRVSERKAASWNVLVTEVVPANSTLEQSIYSSTSDGWKVPIEQFTSKREASSRKYSRRIRSYYEAQGKLISAYENIEKGRGQESDDTYCHVTSHYEKGMFYSRLTFFVNVLLLVAKLVASVLSGSIAVISSLVDSSLDIFSGVILWWASRAVKSRSLYTYPQGRTKLEPVAIVILAVVMALASVQIIRESIEKIIDLSHSSDDPALPDVRVVTFCIMGLTIVTKLILYLLCRRVQSHLVQALAQDHRNDVVSNTVAILCGYLGSSAFLATTNVYGFSYVDPTGAMLISVYIIYNWWQTGSQQIKMLTGHTARPDFLSQLTWVALNHHPKVKQVDTVRAFHFGSNFLVEVDIVLPSSMPLREAHDIGESLQQRIESLPDVERGFVHLDYESTHHPNSEHKIV